MRCNRANNLLVVLVGIMGFAAAPAVSSTFQSGGDVHISPLHQIDDDFWAYAPFNDVIIDGTVTGDLIGVCSQANIKGKIGRSIILASRSANHAGVADGSLRWIGERLDLAGRVGGSIVAYGAQIVLHQGSVVEKDVNAGAKEIDLAGQIRGNVDCTAKTVRISGQIEGDVKLSAKEIVIAPPAVVSGNLTYTAESEDLLTLEPGATVAGDIVWKECEPEDEDDRAVSDWAFKAAGLLAAFIFGAIMFSFFRSYAEESFHQLRNRFSVALAAGLLYLLALILAVIILVLSLAGTLIGTVLLSGELAAVGVIVLVLSILMTPISLFVTACGTVIFYSGKIVVGLVLGYLILRRSGPVLNRWALLVGLIILTLVTAVPYIGFVITLLTAITGAGAIVLAVRNCRRRLHPDSAKEESRPSESEPAPAQ